MKRLSVLSISLLLLALLLAACSGANTSPAAPFTNISVDELKSMMANKDFTLVNVHIPFEGDLPQTDLSIPYDEIEDHLAELPGKDEKIVLYCRSGSMSETAGNKLAELGYTNLYELDGGMIAWEEAGLPLEK